MASGLENIETVESPFRRFVTTIGVFPTAFTDAMTYYECLAYLVKYLEETVIPAVNENAEAVEELQELYIQLKTFVDTYFDNLDVQKEINNKLDQMAEAGTLQEIITTYIQANVAWTFDTVADMKLATNLVNGSYAQTLGFHSVDDGGGALYKISNTGTANEHDVIAVGSLYATIVTPVIATPEMYGAYGDLTHDDTDAFIACVANSKCIKADKQYTVNDNLVLQSGTKLFGNGMIRQTNGVDKKLIDLESVSDITIEGLTICNESSQVGTPANYAGQYLIWIEESDHITIKDCHFKDAYKRGIEVFRSSDIVYRNNTFKNATFDMLMLFPEVENVLVEDSIFDTITSDLTIAYLFATGSNDYSTTFAFSTKDITVNNCKFLNNPKWEGIDTHACVGFTCTNNYVENCYRGCMARYDIRIKTSSEKKHGDLVFKNNTFIGNNVSTMPAIITGGDPTYFVKNILIENNNADNWGASGTNNNAAIDVENAKYVDIIRNKITNSKGSHLYTVNVTFANINDNIFLDTTRNVAILLYVGSWFINFKNNVVRNLKSQKQNAFNYQGIINFDGNDIEGFNSPFYGTKTNMVGIVNQYTTQMGKSGNYVRNEHQIITHYCTDPVVRANTAGTMSFTGTINNGSYDVVTSARYTYDLCEGEEIVITGAGSAGADLTTIIEEVIDETHFKVRDMAETGVSNASISTTASTWVAV